MQNFLSQRNSCEKHFVHYFTEFYQFSILIRMCSDRGFPFRDEVVKSQYIQFFDKFVRLIEPIEQYDLQFCVFFFYYSLLCYIILWLEAGKTALLFIQSDQLTIWNHIKLMSLTDGAKNDNRAAMYEIIKNECSAFLREK